MRVKYRLLSPGALTPKEAYFVVPQQTNFTVGKEYEVYGLSVYDGVTFLQVIDDINTIKFSARGQFEVVNSEIPVDWICTTVADGPVQLLLGPPYMARDLAAYNGMIDHDSEQNHAFYARNLAPPPKRDDDDD